MTSNPSPRRRREVIDALRRGTVPASGLDLLAVGLDRFMPALDASLDAVASGGTAFKAVREVPRDGLLEWREAVRRHLRPASGMTLLDVGAGTGTFAAAFSEWFDVSVVAVEPSAAMRGHIARAPAVRVLEGNASSLPLPDGSADTAWLSLVLHHIPDLEAAAHEIRRVLRPGAPVLIRGGVSGGVDLTRQEGSS